MLTEGSTYLDRLNACLNHLTSRTVPTNTRLLAHGPNFLVPNDGIRHDIYIFRIYNNYLRKKRRGGDQALALLGPLRPEISDSGYLIYNFGRLNMVAKK